MCAGPCRQHWQPEGTVSWWCRLCTKSAQSSSPLGYSFLVAPHDQSGTSRTCRDSRLPSVHEHVLVSHPVVGTSSTSMGLAHGNDISQLA